MSNEIKHATILFAGDSGDGMQLTGSQFTNTVAQMGSDMSTFPDFPAEIRAPMGTVAGVSGFQLKFGSIDITSPGDVCDVLVVMNSAALKKNLDKLKPHGIIIANTSGFDAKNLRLAKYETNPLDGIKADYQIHEIDILGQTLEALKTFTLPNKQKDQAKNMFALGFVYWLYTKPLDYTVQFLEQKFGKDPVTYESNLAVLKAGYNFGEITEAFSERYTVGAAKMPTGTYRNITGNQALSIGLIAAAKKSGLELFFSGYPITPASDILHTLARYKHFPVKTIQVEDEIAAVTSCVGAAYGGNLAVTASSGPGIALKAEGLGLAMMLELPMVVVNVQRGGPSTGLPTKTEQSDLMQALYGRNGEAPIPVVAAKSPSHCFEMAFMATKIAVEHMTPVFLLSDGYLANGSEPWKFPQEKDLESITPNYPDPAYKGNYLPYKRDERLVRTWALPGMEGFENRVGGLEKEDLTGNVSYDAENHHKMVKIRQAKIDKIADFIPNLTIDSGVKKGKVLLLGWGSTYGSIRSAMKMLLDEGVSVAHAHLEYINPLPKNVGEILKQFDTVIVPELNNGQLVKLIREKFLVDAKPLNKIKGSPFTSHEIYDAVIDAIK